MVAVIPEALPADPHRGAIPKDASPGTPPSAVTLETITSFGHFYRDICHTNVCVGASFAALFLRTRLATANLPIEKYSRAHGTSAVHKNNVRVVWVEGANNERID
jgi:hypothetical protein